MKYRDENGNYQDIYVKAFDTLPVGSEVDYDGQTVPDGWTEINTWKFLGTKTGNTTIDISNIDFNELYVQGIAKTSATDTGICIDFYIIKNTLTSTEMSYRKGYQDTTSFNGLIFINVSTSTIRLGYAVRNGTETTNVSTINVYYK